MSSACSKKVLMVCLGNICRSPMAECILRHKWEQLEARDGKQNFSLVVDSCGTAGYHIGNPSDRRTIQVLKNHKIECSHRARKLKKSDGDEFDFILCMDESNLSDTKSVLGSKCKAHVQLLGSYDPQGFLEVDDPYYGGNDGFQLCFEHCSRALDKFIKTLLN